MTEDCNKDVLAQARRNVADKFHQDYHINAILRGDWDSGKYVQDEIKELLRNPPDTQDVVLSK